MQEVVFEDNEDLISDETALSSLKVLRDVAVSVVNDKLKNLNIELYKDMKITNITPIQKVNSEEIAYYTYDVIDSDTKETYDNIQSKSEPSDGYKIGDLVRVFVSNIVYIGFKI